MTRRARVDAELVRRGLARSRQQAAELIGDGRVTINGMPAAKPATAVEMTAALAVEGSDEKSWVSRGAHKLIGALEDFRIDVAGRRCLHDRRLTTIDTAALSLEVTEWRHRLAVHADGRS